MQTSIMLRRYAFLYFVILVLTFGLTSGKHIVAQAEPATPDFATIDTYIEDQMKKSHIPGLTLGIVKDDQITHLQAFGEADDTRRLLTSQTPMMLGSVSKSFTALAVMQLVEQGKIDLDAPVQRYLPWFRLADEAASARLQCVTCSTRPVDSPKCRAMDFG